MTVVIGPFQDVIDIELQANFGTTDFRSPTRYKIHQHVPGHLKGVFVVAACLTTRNSACNEYRPLQHFTLRLISRPKTSAMARATEEAVALIAVGKCYVTSLIEYRLSVPDKLGINKGVATEDVGSRLKLATHIELYTLIINIPGRNMEPQGRTGRAGIGYGYVLFRQIKPGS